MFGANILWRGAGKALYSCTLLPNGGRRRDTDGATWRFAAIAQVPETNVR
jgi:hypothetical protein